MAAITCSRRVDAPLERVFDTFADFPNAADRIHDIVRVEMLTDGPLGVGTRFRETRIMFGKEATEEMQMTRFDRPQGYTVEAHSCGAHYITTFDFQAAGPDASQVTMTMQVKAESLTARLMTPLTWLLAGTVRKALEKDMDDLATFLDDTLEGSGAK